MDAKHCSTQESSIDIVLEDTIDSQLLSKWPKQNMKVPTIMLHKTVDFSRHVRELLTLKINFYQPYLSTNYTKIFCQTFDDHKAMLMYFEKNNLPYHTFGYPNKRKMKVVIRGLPKDTDLNKLELSLKSVSIPLVRLHKMHMKEFPNNPNILVLVIVPNNDEGRNVLRVKKLLGHDITLEPPIPKTKQCHRCQKWGHSQRYCYGEVKCLKCAENHYTSNCTRDAKKEPPTCANCGGDHTANYKECFHCPDSVEYEQNRNKKLKNITPVPYKKRELVTVTNYQLILYKKVNNIPNHEEAIPF